MEFTVEERGMLQKIVSNQYTGGGYKRSTRIETICRTGADKTVLAALCQKGLVETGLGGTPGDPQRRRIPTGKRVIALRRKL